ncbi:DUF1289 domain-containing protein [Pararoseomonas sp. SCSIO 73927]|uniref:DUF1289 domain-containing protein n=1 Tax=Pararoseomonas sp. SCSIO 73927 TaxID=3114537 RepID=UPI0030D0A84A
MTREGDAVPSPCTGLCRLDAAEVCLGCGRAIGEIVAWPGADAAARRAIRARAEARRAILARAEAHRQAGPG